VFFLSVGTQKRKQDAVEEKDEATKFAEVLSGLVLLLSGFLLSGLVGMVLYNWFIPVIYHSMPRLNAVEALGIRLVAFHFVGTLARELPQHEKDFKADLKRFGSRVGLAAAFLGVGFVLHLLML
jgi:hypothetical protein